MGDIRAGTLSHNVKHVGFSVCAKAYSTGIHALLSTYFFRFAVVKYINTLGLFYILCCCELFNPLKPELNPICYLLALLGAHHFLHVSRIRVKLLTFRRLMSYIYMEHPFLMFLDHTQRRSTVGRTPLDE